ncbi:MAG TPA: hypothetical protein ENH26_01705 [Candidatus Wolfebacteria bacterium]|nr:hypothetical protein [Candidatus Wolfebacteria bacterium]
MEIISRIPGYGKLAALLLVFLSIAGPLTVSNGEVETKKISAESAGDTTQSEEISGITIISNDSLLAQNKIEPLSQNIKIVITAYSSSPEETDDTPFITASGTFVRQGVAAANFLPIGTKIKLPDVFGDQVFIIEDRMHPRFNDRVDIWFAEKTSAKIFGKQLSRIEVL